MTEERYPWFGWQPATLGRWEREIDEAERFYAVMGKAYEGTGRTFFAITGFASIALEDPGTTLEEAGRRVEAALRNAWLRLRYDHPTIASRVEFDPCEEKWSKSYTPFETNRVKEQQEGWLRETFVAVTPNITGLEWCNADPPAPKLPTLFVITPPSNERDEAGIIRRDLVLRSPHDIIDGIGTLVLINNLLEKTAKAYLKEEIWTPPAPGSEVDQLSPPLRVAAAIPPILTLPQQEQLQSLISSNSALRKGVKILTLPFKQGPTSPGKHQRTALELSTSETAQLRTASKHLGATVTHLYHAAIAIALRDLQAPGQEPQHSRYLSYSLINERPKCKGDFATTKHAAAVYHSVAGNSLALDLTIPSTADVQNKHDRQIEYRNLVSQVKTYYHAIRDSPDFLPLAPSFLSLATPELAHRSPKDKSHRPVPAPNPSPSVSLSSMGVVDKIISPQHGPFRVRNPWVTGEELGTGMGMFLGTWEGALCLSVAYNDAWHDRGEAEGFLRRVHDVVREGVSLETVDDSKS